jgi:carboxyl-terminal processing protease
MRFRAIVAALLFGSTLGAGAWWLRRDVVELPPLDEVREPSVGPRLFEQVQTIIATRYVDSLPLDSIYRKAVAGLMDELNDPYSSFLPEQRMRRLSEQMAGNYGGVGAQIDLRDGWITVIEPTPGAPAERAGVQAGDRIVEIEGESTRGLTTDEVTRLLRGAPGSIVEFTVQRFGQYRFTVKVAREAVVRRAVPRVAMLRPGVGYVDLNVFSANTAAELRTALDSLDRLGARGVLLDLRGNPGGLLEQGVAVAELFLDPGQRIVELRGRPRTAPEVIADREPQSWPWLAVAVLIDGNSASASEIVAGALQDNDRAIVVGRTSFGKGSAQSVFPMTTGGALRLTTARWYTPLGRSISPVLDSALSESEIARGMRVSRPAEDSARPRFTTEAGRTVVGGGAIVPDVFAGDTALPAPVQAFVRALGTETPAYRDAVARVALLHKQRGTFTSPLHPMTREIVNAVWEEIERRRLPVDRQTFDAAAPWIARSLGYEITRVTFGPDAEFLRRSQNDPVIVRALRLLDGARTPREPFARTGDPGITLPVAEPALEE